MTRVASLGLFLALASCAGDVDHNNEPVFGASTGDSDLVMARTANSVEGVLTEDNGAEITFESTEVEPGVVVVDVTLNGMTLHAEYDWQDAHFDGLDGEGEPTLITDMDRASLARLTAALEAEFYPPIYHVQNRAQYDALRNTTLAEEKLFSSVEGIWSMWPSTQPLAHQAARKDFEEIRSHYNFRYYTKDADTYIPVSQHDCPDIWLVNDGCERSDADCQDYKAVGRYFDGANHANCGISSTGSQFTKNCADHDQCVRTSKHGGHNIASPFCSDELGVVCVNGAAGDECWADSCEYDFRGSSMEGNCPTSYEGDGICDCFCQFKDPDCL